MKTVFITKDYSPAVAYSDYCILYRKANGNMDRCLKLMTFVNKINKGRFVKIHDTMFAATPAYNP